MLSFHCCISSAEGYPRCECTRSCTLKRLHGVAWSLLRGQTGEEACKPRSCKLCALEFHQAYLHLKLNIAMLADEQEGLRLGDLGAVFSCHSFDLFDYFLSRFATCVGHTESKP